MMLMKRRIYNYDGDYLDYNKYDHEMNYDDVHIWWIGDDMMFLLYIYNICVCARVCVCIWCMIHDDGKNI